MKGYIKLVSVLIIVMAFAVAASADTPPASITSLQNTTYEETYIEWTWDDPTDSNFTHVIVYIDGVLQSPNTTKNVEFFNATGLSSGVNHEIATHTVGTNDSINTAWENETAWTKSAPPDTTPPASITSLQNTTYGETYINWTWDDPTDADFKEVIVYIDGVLQSPNTTKNVEFFNATGLSSGVNHEIATYTVDTTGNINTAGENETAWTKSTSAPTTGNRIWDEDKNMPSTYAWTAQSFTGFYYDLDDNIDTETLTIKGINLNGRVIDEGNITYVTETSEVDFDYNGWEQYEVIGFMAEKYFAGYSDNTSDQITSDDISLVSKDILSKVLIDDDDGHTISTGASLELKEGYELKIIQLDVNGNKAQLELIRNGKSADTEVVDTGNTFVYKKDLGKVDDVPIIAVHIKSVFAGTETAMVEIDGIFQISEDYTSVKDGEDHGEMEIKSSTSTEITMDNRDDITLEAGEIVDLMGTIKFLVADDSDLRFALYEEITEPGTYDIRGTVMDTRGVDDTWTHMNFEGFYYDIDGNLGTEELTVDGNGDIEYTTTPNLVEFDYSDWDEYEVIGFMAEKYFAGYSGTKTSDDITDDDISLISKEMLSKVLIDTDEDRTLSTGASLQLEEGYELKIIQLDVNGDKAQLELIHDGKSVDTEVVNAGRTFVYKKDLGKLDDVPIIAVHIQSVFAGTETAMVELEGVFQISEDYTSVKDGDDYGEMEVKTTSKNRITMEADDVNLDDGETTMIMEDVGFEVSEDGNRYYLFVRRTIGSLDALAIDISETPIVDEELVITVTDGSDPVEGADVTFGGENLGITDSNGEVRHTPGDAGTFTVTASKENYDSASEDVDILTEGEAELDALDLAMPEVVDPDEEMIIRVTSGGDAIEGAMITWDDEEIGETDDTGSLTYSHEGTGTYTVTASKSGYLDASEKITVSIPAAKFELDGISLPAEVAKGKSFTITTNVTNVGDVEGTYRAELVIDDGNGTVIGTDSQNVTLAAGDTETVQFTYKIAEAGTYTVQIGDKSDEITVTASESKTALVAVILLILAVLGGVGYVLISSAPEGGWTAEKLIEAIKDKLPGKKGL